MEKFKYRALNQSGRQTRGVISAKNEIDLSSQLESAGLVLIDCRAAGTKSEGGFRLNRTVKIRELIQLFIHFDQMQSAGIAMLECLSDIRDTADNEYLRDIMSEIYRDVYEGSALSEAMEKHPKVFSSLYISLIRAGEKTGDLPGSYRNLVKYLTWVDEMQRRIRKATTYPMIASLFIIGVIVFYMTMVVPQMTSFIQNIGRDLPFITIALIATSDFFVKYWWAILGSPILLFIGIKSLKKVSTDFAYRMDAIALKLPAFGSVIRKVNISRFSQTFASLYASGLDIINALKAAQNTVQNRILSESLDGVLKSIQSGRTLSESLNSTGEFPSMVVRMIKVGEESGNLTEVLEHVTDFYNKDVDEAVQTLITYINPALIVILASVIVWLAVGVFGPLYSNFDVF